jgi:hypothetical protein
MIIHSPIISGSLTFANGATFTLPDNGIYSGSFSGSVAGLGDPKTFSASLETKIQQLNIDTGSQDARLDLIESYTSSLETKNSTLAVYTASVDTQLSNLNSATSSYETKGNGIVSGSSQITISSTTGYTDYSSSVATSISASSAAATAAATWNTLSGKPAGIVSGSSQTIINLNSAAPGVVSGSTQTIANLPTGTVSGSSQLSGTTITDLTIVNLTTINETASVIFSSGSNRFGDFGNDTHSFTGSVQISGSQTITGTLTVTGAITATGDITAFSASDIRFKENIITIESPIKKIKMISGNTYDWKAENKDIHGFEGNDVGVIAQEIEEVLPQLVVTRDNGYKAVKYDKLVALLIEGIKEQQKQIEDLSNKINKLETEL